MEPAGRSGTAGRLAAPQAARHHHPGGPALPARPAAVRPHHPARPYADSLWRDLSAVEVAWRPDENSSAIGWHLGHQAYVAHFMIRNLTAAKPSPAADVEWMLDSAKPEPRRGGLSSLDRIGAFWSRVADRVRLRVGAIERGDTGAPKQMLLIGAVLLTAVINHEYQNDQ